MRPNKFWTEMYKAICHKLKTGSGDKFTPYLMKRAKRAHDDMRKDPDMIGYRFDGCFDVNQSPKVIRNHLMYISDRFMSPHHLGWMIEGVECGRLLMKENEKMSVQERNFYKWKLG